MDREKVEHTAQVIADRFNTAFTSSAVKWLFLSSYVERVIGWAWRGGALSNVALFLRECLSMKDKIVPLGEKEELGPSVMKMEPL
jgi:hypothetical protein